MNRNNKLSCYIIGLLSRFKEITVKQDISIFNWYLFNVIIGVLLSELFYFGYALGKAFFALIAYYQLSDYLRLGSCTFLVCVLAFYCYVRKPFEKLSFYKKNKYFYLTKIFFVVIGILISSTSNGIFDEEYQRLLSKIFLEPLIFITSIPLVIAVFFLISSMAKYFKKQDPKQPYFLNDDPIDNETQDVFGLSENAKRFSNLVLNQNSPDSLVFGIDSPWGAGKTSFIKICNKNYWGQMNEEERPIVVFYDPIKYLDQDNLAEKLAYDISHALNKYSRNPALNSSFEKYINILKENNQLSFFGINFKIPINNNLKEKLESEIAKLNRKIIVVIDDLDRLSWSESKKILFGIKQSFRLENVTYVLCYDSNNLKFNAENSEIQSDGSELLEFLEKFVQIKFTIFIDRLKLAKLVGQDSKKILDKIYIESASYYDQIQSILAKLQMFYNADTYYKYAHFLGDLRKVKRLINSILLLNIPALDTKNSDIDGGDLIRLMIIYINFPQTFRKIYDAEMGGNGQFSLVESGDDFKYDTSEELLRDIDSNKYNKHEVLVLKSLFDKTTLENEDNLKIAQLNESNRACFNGVRGTPRNLERYLNLIVNLKLPAYVDTSDFINKHKENYVNGMPLTKILSSVEFDSNEVKIKLLNKIVNSSDRLDANKARQIVDYILGNIDKFSLTGRNHLGTDHRSSLIYILLKVIDKELWRNEGTYINSIENLKPITDFIFGEGEFAKSSIINQLTQDLRLPLGFYDLLLFRLYCSADRANSLFNIQKALSKRYDINAPIEGPVIAIARDGMRQISQEVFKRFEEKYIKPKRNFYSDVINLEVAYLNCEESSELHRNQFNEIEIAKSTVLSFAIYQLTNKLIQGGIGCGYYDVTGDKDKNEISRLMNKYLFDVCFNPDVALSNIENFIHYLLNHLSTPFETGDTTLQPKMEKLTVVLDKDMLVSFWKKNKEAIIKAGYHLQEKVVHNVNYEVIYKEFLPVIYKMLDDEV